MQSIRQPIAQNQFSACNAIACQNTMESFEWKKTLIQAADHILNSIRKKTLYHLSKLRFDL